MNDWEALAEQNGKRIESLLKENAALRSAGVEMLEALRLQTAALNACVQNMLGIGNQPPPEQTKAALQAGRDAIAKAEGK